MSKRTSDPLYIFLVFFVLIELIVVIIVTAFASRPTDPMGMFRNATGAVSDKYCTDIVPAGWANKLWSVIYIWQAAWIIYAIVNVCRSNKFGKVYLNPPTIPTSFLAVYSTNLALIVAWLFAWDRQYLPVSTAILALITFSAYTCLWINHRAVCKDIDQLRRHHKVDLWLNRILVQNGIAIYATWCAFAALLNFTNTITYFAGVEQTTACLISLSILAAELVFYFILDNFIWDKYLRTTFVVYPVIIWATTAALLNNWNAESVVSMYTAAIVGLACAAFVLKQIMLVVRACRGDTTYASKNNGNKMAMDNYA